MLFNSYEFIFFFLPMTFGVYFWLNHKRLTYASKGWMVGASLFFYSWWNVAYLPLILGSILVNFILGTTLSKGENAKGISRKTILVTGIGANILLLGYFKYMDFFITNVNVVLGSHWELMHIVLPLGISFFTFTQIAYLVDAYRHEVKEMDYLNYTLFVTFFPHLLAGPILHHKEMMPQFDALKNKVVNYKNISAGLFLFSMGLFKKVVIADTFAQWANAGFSTSAALNFLEAWATSLSYTFQLYFDFSGYTDMALAVALMFNIKLPANFNSPYKAVDVQDFWRRWHITLSRFLRDYIYIPLGGNRKGEWHTYANLFSVFLIGGLWHGASWMFVIWGALHGIAIVLHRMWKQLGLTMNTMLAWFITFNFINITWIFFRAKDWGQAKNIFLGMGGIQWDYAS
jgi:D-alanyl-lipoteichoic acid acyltransferase DltB (MBOAT superfamily)